MTRADAAWISIGLRDQCCPQGSFNPLINEADLERTPAKN